MSNNFKYKINGTIKSNLEVIDEAYVRAKNFDPETRKEYLKIIGKEFTTNNMRNKLQSIFLPTFGVLFLIACLTIAFFYPHPSQFQTGTFWVTLSLASAACAALIPGFIEFKYNGFLRAGGAIAVFCIMYFFVPTMAKSNEINNISNKFSIFVFSKDTTKYQTIKVDFNLNSSKKVNEFATECISKYYGNNLNVKDYTCYNKSDGKIYSEEKCIDIKEYELIVISNSVILNYIDKREAYAHFVKIFQ